MKQKDRILVVGSDGTIGSSLSEHLKELGFFVVRSGRRSPAAGGYLKMDFGGAESDILKSFESIPAIDFVVFCPFPVTSGLSPELAQVLSDHFYLRAKCFVELCTSRKIPVIFLSSNYVFDGCDESPSESQVPSPICVYGRGKADFEKVVLSLSDRNAVLRLSKVIAQNTAPFVGWMQSLKTGHIIEPIQNLSFSPVSLHMVLQVVTAIATQRAKGIFHLGGAEQITYAAAADLLARRMKLDPSLIRSKTATIQQIPRVSRSSLMSCQRIISEFGFQLEAPDEALSHLLSGPVARLVEETMRSPSKELHGQP